MKEVSFDAMMAQIKEFGFKAHPLRLEYEQLLETKSYNEIIESSCRPIQDLDNRLKVEEFLVWTQERGFTSD